MNEVYCYDITTKRKFTRVFDNLHSQRVFLLRCKYSKKIIVEGYTYQGQAQYEYLEFGR